MITEDYVSFEIAKLLKEKGFDETCIGFYTPEKELHFTFLGETNSMWLDDSISAPTLQMAMKWLREIHHIFIEIDWDARPEPIGSRNKPYFSLIINMNIGDFYKGKDLPSECTSYEEACESAIKYCLENLI